MKDLNHHPAPLSVWSLEARLVGLLQSCNLQVLQVSCARQAKFWSLSQAWAVASALASTCITSLLLGDIEGFASMCIVVARRQRRILLKLNHGLVLAGRSLSVFLSFRVEFGRKSAAKGESGEGRTGLGGPGPVPCRKTLIMTPRH